MDIKTALQYMTVEKAIELEEKRFFCNADKTINTIAVSSMEKQIPYDPRKAYMHYDEGNEKLTVDIDRKGLWWLMIQLLPSSYNQRATVQLN